MSIRMMCPNLKCRRILAVPLEARGKTVRCKGCSALVAVPAAPQPKPIEPQPAQVVEEQTTEEETTTTEE